MRILYVIDSLDQGGTERSMVELLPALLERGVRPALAVQRDAGPLADRARALVIQMLAALEGAFVLSRALRSTEPVEEAGEASVAAIEAALSCRSTAGTG